MGNYGLRALRVNPSISHRKGTRVFSLFKFVHLRTLAKFRESLAAVKRMVPALTVSAVAAGGRCSKGDREGPSFGAQLICNRMTIENCDAELPTLLRSTNSPIQTIGHPGKRNPRRDLRQAISQRKMRPPILPLVVRSQSQRTLSRSQTVSQDPKMTATSYDSRTATRPQTTHAVVRLLQGIRRAEENTGVAPCEWWKDRIPHSGEFL